ncbi:unnamed protein product, partial [Pylaiella littoralis]
RPHHVVGDGVPRARVSGRQRGEGGENSAAKERRKTMKTNNDQICLSALIPHKYAKKDTTPGTVETESDAYRPFRPHFAAAAAAS